MSVRRYNKGFTLVELVVVVAIFGLITLIVLVRHQAFNNTVLLESLAHDIALSIREAQVFGTGVLSTEQGFDVARGINFSEGIPTQYVVFADFDGDNKVDWGTDEELQRVTIGRGFSIVNICGQNLSGTSCTADSSLAGISVLFKRPDPDANLFSNNAATQYSILTVFVQSPEGAQRTVQVTSTGVISVLDS